MRAKKMEMSFSAKQFAVGGDLDNSYSVATKDLYVSLNLRGWESKNWSTYQVLNHPFGAHTNICMHVVCRSLHIA